MMLRRKPDRRRLPRIESLGPPPGNAPRCESCESPNVRITLQADRATYYRCTSCGHQWVVDGL